MTNIDYKKAYHRQKQARELAERMLESRTNELHEANQSIVVAYGKLKNQKAQIIHQEKLASIGQLSAGVAHEINNPTGYVKSNINSLQRYVKTLKNAFSVLAEKCEDSACVETVKKQFDIEFLLEDLEDLARDSMDGLARIEDIVKSLKCFARPDDDEPHFFCINECINNTLKLVSSEIKYKAAINLHLEKVPQISGQQGSMSQVILNLVVNAAQAITHNGEITVRSYRQKDELVVEVRDNGAGIPFENLQKIFDPFFTTKEVGVGTGLGLSVSHSIVQKHGGRIAVDSKVGEGTLFSIYLPVGGEDR